MRILLLRHGKSAWDDGDQADVDRPLTTRGVVASALMGAWINQSGLDPDLVLTSIAQRCQETWARAAPNVKKNIDVSVEKRLYMADPKTMLSVLGAAPKSAKTVLIVGHQPGLSSFARKLARDPAPSACRRAYEKFPTCGLAVLEVASKKWGDVSFGEAEFKTFVTPKELV